MSDEKIANRVGHVSVNAKALLALRDELVKGDHMEAYHILRMMVDRDGSAYMRCGNHWADWETTATFSPDVSR